MEPIINSKHVDGLYKADAKKKLTICEIHRKIYNKFKDTEHMTDELRYLLERGFVIGKKMHYRLAKYKHNWTEDVYKENLNGDHQKITQNQPIEWKWLSK